MIIKLFDKTEITVTKQEAEGVEKAINRGTKMVKVKGMLIATSAIAIIKPGGVTEAEVTPAHMRLDKPDHRGEPSPALEKLRERFGNVPPSKQETKSVHR